MNTVRMRGATALTAAIALAIGGIPAAFTTSSILAAGEGPTTLSAGAAPLGELVVSTTSAGGTVSFNGSTETFIGGQQCEIMPAMDGASSKLLNITGNVGGGPGTAGFRDGSIGVYEFDEEGDGPQNASQCFRVDANSFTLEESLALTLDADLSDRFGRFYATTATINPVAQSRDGQLVITLIGPDPTVETDDVTFPPVPWSRMKSGQLIKNLPALDGKFYGIVLKATSGSFSLTGAEAATFAVKSEADAAFCSDGNATNPGGTDTITRDNTTVTYVGNAQTSGSTCFGVQLISQDTAVQFLKPLDVAPDAQFQFDVDWTLLNEPNGTPGVTIPETMIDFEVAPANETVMPFCSSFEGFEDAAGEPILARDPSTRILKINNYEAFADPDPASPFDDFEPATKPRKEWGCIDTRTTDVTEETIVVHDVAFVIGDVRMRL